MKFVLPAFLIINCSAQAHDDIDIDIDNKSPKDQKKILLDAIDELDNEKVIIAIAKNESLIDVTKVEVVKDRKSGKVVEVAEDEEEYDCDDDDDDGRRLVAETTANTHRRRLAFWDDWEWDDVTDWVDGAVDSVGSFFKDVEKTYHCSLKPVVSGIYRAGSELLDLLDVDDDEDGPTVKDLLEDHVSIIVGQKRAGKFLTQVKIFKTEILKNANGPVSL